ncbi:hypothetical protein KR032_006597 [Drosophila birchii]|nr:hypothetical protein KR032_006597 [Drosophila birchii]
MKPQTSKTSATPKGKAKATEKPKTGKGKAATTNAAAAGKARVAAEPPAPPPMNSKKVAKAPAVALKSLEKKVNDTEDVSKKAVGTKRQAASASGSSSSVASKKVRSNAPAAAAAQKTKPGTKVATPTVAEPAPTPQKKLRVLLKKPSSATLATVKEEEVEEKEADTKAKADKTKKPAAKATKLTPKPQPKKPKKLLLRGKGAGSKKKVWQRFVLDCSCLVEDQLMDLSHLEKYMKSHIKVNQRINNLGDLVNFERPKNTTLVINSSVHFAKRYFKYLTKRYLKKNSLRDWVRMVSTSKDTFTMRYFKIQDDDNDDDDVIDMKE